MNYDWCLLFSMMNYTSEKTRERKRETSADEEKNDERWSPIEEENSTCARAVGASCPMNLFRGSQPLREGSLMATSASPHADATTVPELSRPSAEELLLDDAVRPRFT